MNIYHILYCIIIYVSGSTTLYMIKEGLLKLLEQLSEGIEIEFGNPVTSIDYTEDLIDVSTQKKSYRCHKALVTLPLGVLKSM